MKLKYLAITTLMITILLLLSNETRATTENEIQINEEKEYTIEGEIKLKTLPLIYSIENGKIESGKLKVVEIINDWCNIENNEQKGWVRTNQLKKVIKLEKTNNSKESKEEQKPEETTQTPGEKEPKVKPLSKTGYVSASGLKVRKGPTTSSEEIDSIALNDKVTITGEVDGWYQINHNGEVGYVSGKYISDTKIKETTSRGGIDRTNKKTADVENEEIVEEVKVEQEEKAEEQVLQENIQGEIQENEANSSMGEEIVEFAKQYMGYKYISGGSSPAKGFDCSGFTSYVYSNFGINLSRTSKGQNSNGVAVKKSNLAPGDIVIFRNQGNSAIGHVGIYIGNGKFIHAANRKEGVTITSLSSSYYAKRYVGARRVI